MPNRILKESVCTSESVDQLKPFEETFFYRLIVNCDDYGRFDARARILKSKLFPLKDSVTLKNIEDGLRVLVSSGLVNLYEVDGRSFLFLPTWEAHQQVRAKKSKYPAPEEFGNQLISDDFICPRNPIQSESNPNPIRESACARKKFTPPTIEDVSDYCKKRNNGIDAESFIAFYASKGWKVGNQSMKDWKAAIVTWEKKEKQKSIPRPIECSSNRSYHNDPSAYADDSPLHDWAMDDDKR